MTAPGNWRYVYASVPGVAHLSDGSECQDACAVRPLSGAGTDSLLLLVVADGAGSAARGGTGAELACETFLRECELRLPGITPANWTPALAETLLERVRAALAQEAATAEVPIRDFACTLLGAAVAADHALVLQIGDGAIVIGADEYYRPVFWPQTGQYVNETRFVTDSDAAVHLECVVLAETVAEIALLTDGLQTLALHYQHQQAHTPFFRPMFHQLRAQTEPGSSELLTNALARFLASPAVNERTHDDKTLILATRLSPLTPGIAPTMTADTPAVTHMTSDPDPDSAASGREDSGDAAS
ncbi:hypothetical protein BN873_210065 [Candidatus Competibacter denitrificans Run_A_D11]|uniref:PPM-type phosphatase domain-containing protein n=1 Tax=Candidatus Competibacter denitrificans Run_A_D11 TaxID=1400863 RepID=W6M5D3_9GAMM|nr:PP2C family serine/threonine-protein phosphatase [Candidatus Competibacter denitrificans]CDI01844.1 hypothetical protein BN873_210065 [Candidatus Competibacter denitrificans Run_A_D11]HAS86644.1 protein phosphatase 2C domain-containing protein [Candidatus Competibacteraceae bacterium]HRC68070.1 PP2C family serine/threonine-protein phosphatase [Candidatus Competibacter denitrificans]